MGLIITDEKLRVSVNRFFEKLEKYYPEHKVFAFDSIDKDLRERLSELYKKAGCKTAEEFLAAYGFQIISGDEVRKIRGFVLYTPGNEPDVIKGKVENMLRRLREYYPDGKITRGLQNDHKSLSQSVSGLYQWLGYESANEMLSAYGFDAQYADSGRPSNDHQGLIAALQEKYKDGNKVKSLGLLIHDNPEYAGQIKTLSNRANELFGMSLAKYLKEVGVLGTPEGTSEKAQADKKKYYHYFLVSVDGTETKIPCATDTRTVHEGDYIEMCGIHDNIKTIGCVAETCYYAEEEALPCPVEQMQQYIRKLLKSELKEIEASKVQYIYCRVQLQDRYDTLYYLSPFEDIEEGDVVVVPHNWYGMVTGVVTDVMHVSEKTAPYPVKKAKKIAYVSVKVSDERIKAVSTVEKITKESQTQNFIMKPEDTVAVENYAQCTHFASAVFRGLETDVRAALRVVHPSSFNSFSYSTALHEGIGQFECDSFLVPKILKEFPNLKCVFFAEHWKEKAVYLAYSESGYSTVTSYRFIGKCDFYCRDRWSLIHDPTEQHFSFSDGQYTFMESAQWEKCDYVLSDGKTQLANGIKIPAKPYKKKLTTEPSQIITIRYPENEKFYTPPEFPVAHKAKEKQQKLREAIASGAVEAVLEEAGTAGKLSEQYARGVSAVPESITFKGKNFVHTSCSNEDLIDKYIISKGGEVRSSTVLATDYLIIGNSIDHKTTKISRAEYLNTQGKSIIAMTEEKFWTLAQETQEEYSTAAPKEESKGIQGKSFVRYGEFPHFTLSQFKEILVRRGARYAQYITWNTSYVLIDSHDKPFFSSKYSNVKMINEAEFCELLGITQEEFLAELEEIKAKQQKNKEIAAASGVVELVIDDVSKIQKNAYKKDPTIKTLRIGGKVRSIGRGAFNGCENLESVIIEDGVTELCGDFSAGGNIFDKCKNLKSVEIAGSVKVIQNAFCDCKKLENVSLGEGIEKITWSFDGCSALTKVNLPATLTVGRWMFSKCKNIETLEIPNSVREFSISGCTKLKKLKFPEDMDILLVKECAALKEIDIPKGVKLWCVSGGDSLCVRYSGTKRDYFDIMSTAGYSPAIIFCVDGVLDFTGTELDMSDHITDIREGIFEESQFTTVHLPASLRCIRQDLFRFGKIERIDIPDQVEKIEAFAFSHTPLKEITLPLSLKTLDIYAFSGCDALQTVRYKGTKAQWDQIDKVRNWDERFPAYTVHCTDGDIWVNKKEGR